MMRNEVTFVSMVFLWWAEPKLWSMSTKMWFVVVVASLFVSVPQCFVLNPNLKGLPCSSFPHNYFYLRSSVPVHCRRPVRLSNWKNGLLTCSAKKLSADADENKPETVESLIETLRIFRNKDISEEDLSEGLEFPPSLSAKQRAALHEMCEKLGLGHKSSGDGDERRLKVWQMPVEERLTQLEAAVKAEEAATRAEWETAMSAGSDDQMERAGFLLRAVSISAIELTSFGRARWSLEEDRNRAGHMRLFNARVGSPVILASKNSKTGAWAAAPGARPARLCTAVQ